MPVPQHILERLRRSVFPSTTHLSPILYSTPEQRLHDLTAAVLALASEGAPTRDAQADVHRGEEQFS